MGVAAAGGCGQVEGGQFSTTDVLLKEKRLGVDGFLADRTGDGDVKELFGLDPPEKEERRAYLGVDDNAEGIVLAAFSFEEGRGPGNAL